LKFGIRDFGLDLDVNGLILPSKTALIFVTIDLLFVLI
jgi:hypothetical protein